MLNVDRMNELLARYAEFTMKCIQATMEESEKSKKALEKLSKFENKEKDLATIEEYLEVRQEAQKTLDQIKHNIEERRQKQEVFAKEFSDNGFLLYVDDFGQPQVQYIGD